MNEQQFEDFLYHQIPIVKFMGFKVLLFTPASVKIKAPLKPNVNHKLTAFGGSINCLLTVCGWSIMYANFSCLFPNADIVIQKSEIRYLEPIKKDFYAQCILENENDKKTLVSSYSKFGKGRMSLKINCYCEDRLSAIYEGTFAVTRK